jgi:hypothetical protein
MATCLQQKSDMLRITLPEAANGEVYKLEGRLTGRWVQELLRVVRQSGAGQGTIFDLREVLYVDSSGESALQHLSTLGARFIAESAYGKHLCDHLNLERISAPELSSLQPAMPHRIGMASHVPRRFKTT